MVSHSYHLCTVQDLQTSYDVTSLLFIKKKSEIFTKAYNYKEIGIHTMYLEEFSENQLIS